MKSLIQEALARAAAEKAEAARRQHAPGTRQPTTATSASPAAPATPAGPTPPSAQATPSTAQGWPALQQARQAAVQKQVTAATAEIEAISARRGRIPGSSSAATAATQTAAPPVHVAPAPAPKLTGRPVPPPVFDAQAAEAPALTGDETDAELEDVLAQLNTKIKVFGCGGGGCNTVYRLYASNLENVEYHALNTDAQHLLSVRGPQRTLIGRNLTKGLGAGALPQVGEQAARETEQQLKKQLYGADMVFITAGMGGGTGTGSAPVVAKMAREAGALTIAVVTMPFTVEGAVRKENAEAGLARLRDAADTTIVIPNDKLLEVVPNLPLTAAFKVADEILVRAIRGLSEMITKPGLVNLDFADLKTIMKKGGVAMIGLGESDSDERARDAVNEALSSPLLDVDVSDATGCLVDVVGGADMTLQEAQTVVQEIYNRVSPDCRIIWGASVNPHLDRSIRVMLVITGVKSKQILGPGAGSFATRPRTGVRPGEVDFVL